MRRTTARLTSVLVAALAVAGCASPGYRFVGSSDRDLVLKVPRDWHSVRTDDVLKALGSDPAAPRGWTIFYDAAARPSVAHVSGSSAEAPVLVAQTFELTDEQRATVTDDQMRDVLLPVSAQARAEAAAAALTNPAAPADFHSIDDRTIDTKTEHGVRVVYTYSFAGRPETFDQVVVTDPKRKREHLVIVHCSQDCFAQHADEIDHVLSSLTLK